MIRVALLLPIHCHSGQQADGTFGLCIGSSEGTQGENSGPDGSGQSPQGSGRDENGNTASDHAEMQAMLPFIHQCQAKLADGGVCKTLDPESCAPDPPPAHCEECKGKLMGCVKSLMGGANGGGSATSQGPESGASDGPCGDVCGPTCQTAADAHKQECHACAECHHQHQHDDGSHTSDQQMQGQHQQMQGQHQKKDKGKRKGKKK